MSGLMWAGLGKGISDAGTTFSGYMAKDIEATRLEQREALREERLLARQEALDQIKADREEAKAETLKTRVSTEAVAVEKRALDAPIRRDATALGVIGSQMAGDSPVMSQEERETLIRDNPQYRDVYRSAGLIGEDKMDPRLRSADDQSQAALDIGAHSSVIDAYAKKRTVVLDQIRVENTEKRGDQRHVETMAAISERGRQADARLPILQQNADSGTTRAGAAVTSANRPRSSGAGGAGSESVTLRGLQAESTAASRAVESARKDHAAQAKAVAGLFGDKKAAAEKAMESTTARLRSAEAIATTAQQRISTFNSGRTGPAPAPKAGDNQPSTSGTTKKNYSNLWN